MQNIEKKNGNPKRPKVNNKRSQRTVHEKNTRNRLTNLIFLLKQWRKLYNRLEWEERQTRDFHIFNVDRKPKAETWRTKVARLLAINWSWVAFSEMFVTWNSFFEVIVWTDKLRTEHVLIESIRINTGEQKEKTRLKLKLILLVLIDTSKRTEQNSLTFDYQEIIHFKTTNFRSKYYGKSKFYKTIDQVVLLTKIDQFTQSCWIRKYQRQSFWLIKSWKHRQKVKNQNGDNWCNQWCWVKLQYVIVPGDMWTLSLQDDTETNAFLGIEGRPTRSSQYVYDVTSLMIFLYK